MDLRILFTEKALDDLAEILRHIAEDDGEAAERFGISLLDHIELLKKFPRMGELIKARARVRKLLHSPVLVYYQLHDSRHLVEIVHIRHAARKPPTRL